MPGQEALHRLVEFEAVLLVVEAVFESLLELGLGQPSRLAENLRRFRACRQRCTTRRLSVVGNHYRSGDQAEEALW